MIITINKNRQFSVLSVLVRTCSLHHEEFQPGQEKEYLSVVFRIKTGHLTLNLYAQVALRPVFAPAYTFVIFKFIVNSYL